jgi:hypothetical protein
MPWRHVRVLLQVLVLFAGLPMPQSAGPGDEHILLVCLLEGRDFPANVEPIMLGSMPSQNKMMIETAGIDVTVSLIVGEHVIDATGITDFNDRSPEFQDCFHVGGAHDANTPLTLVASDADPMTPDDLVSVGCTTAVTGTRWVDLSDPRDGKAAGKVRVQIVHLRANPAMDRSEHEWFRWSSVHSETSLSPVNRAGVGVSASVRCPSGSRATACQCHSEGPPGCATAKLRMLADGLTEECVAVGAAWWAPGYLKPCEKDWLGREQILPDCAPELVRAFVRHGGWPSGVRAYARCARETEVGSMRDVISTQTIGMRGDVTVAQCNDDETLLGCSVAEGSGEQMGAAYMNLDQFGSVACLAKTGRDVWATKATARCARLPTGATMPPVGGSPRPVSMPPYSEMSTLQVSIKWSQWDLGEVYWHALRCPEPFALVGCTCMTEDPTLREEHRSCFGVSFQNTSDGLGMCNVSYSHDIIYGLKGPMDLFLNCLWRGETSRIVTDVTKTKDDTCSEVRHSSVNAWLRNNLQTITAGRDSGFPFLNKSWIQGGLQGRVKRTMVKGMHGFTHSARVIHHEDQMESVYVFCLGLLSMALACCCCFSEPRDFCQRVVRTLRGLCGEWAEASSATAVSHARRRNGNANGAARYQAGARNEGDEEQARAMHAIEADVVEGRMAAVHDTQTLL